MHRRRLLAALASSAAAAAGCTSTADQPDTTATASTTTTDRTTATTTRDDATGDDEGDDGDGRRLGAASVVDLETVPLTLSVHPLRYRGDDGASVTVEFARTATADHPATIRGTLENANDFENVFRLRGLPLFDAVPSAWPGGRPRDPEFTYRDELALAPTDGHEFAEKQPTVERADDGRWRLAGDVNGPWLPDRLRLDAGETRAFEYALVGRVEGSGFPARRYEFTGYGDAAVTVAAWETDAPGPTETSRFDGASVPPLPDADAMAWYHDADAATEAYLEPSVEHAELPASVEFTLVNHGRGRLSGNPYHWILHKLRDGEWFHVAPWGWPSPLSYLPPGGTESWTLTAFPEHPVELDGTRGVGYLGGGRYAFEVGMSAGDETHAALVEFDAPPVELEPTGDVSADRRGDRVVVTTPRHDADGDGPDPATLTVTRVASADRRVVAEQVMQPRYRGLRNTLAFLADGVETVELRTDDHTVSRVTGHDADATRFAFRGQAYEARRS